MLAAGASPGQAQLLQAAPRVSLAVHCGFKTNSCSPARADYCAICTRCCRPGPSLLDPICCLPRAAHSAPTLAPLPALPCSLCRRCRWTAEQALSHCHQAWCPPCRPAAACRPAQQEQQQRAALPTSWWWGPTQQPSQRSRRPPRAPSPPLMPWPRKVRCGAAVEKEQCTRSDVCCAQRCCILACCCCRWLLRLRCHC